MDREHRGCRCDERRHSTGLPAVHRGCVTAPGQQRAGPSPQPGTLPRPARLRDRTPTSGGAARLVRQLRSPPGAGNARLYPRDPGTSAGRPHGAVPGPGTLRAAAAPSADPGHRAPAPPPFARFPPAPRCESGLSPPTPPPRPEGSPAGRGGDGQPRRGRGRLPLSRRRRAEAQPAASALSGTNRFL